MTENTKALVRRVPDEIFNQGKLDVIDEIFSSDYVEHAPLPAGFPTGRDAVKAFVVAAREGFPDLHYDVQDILVDGDKAAVHIMVSGTHRGEFGGMPPTGKHARWREIHIARIADGKLVEHWVAQDQVGMLQQLGLMPGPG